MSRYDLTDFEWRVIGRMASSPRRPVSERELTPVMALSPAVPVWMRVAAVIKRWDASRANSCISVTVTVMR